MSSLPYNVMRFFTICTFFLYSSLAATSVSLSLTDNGNGVGGQTVMVGVPFDVSVVVEGGDRETGGIDLALPNHVEVVGSSSSTNVSMINGSFSSTRTQLYRLRTQQEGELKLGPARVRQGDKTIESSLLVLTVVKAHEAGAVPSGQSGQVRDQAVQSEHAAALMCRITANKKSLVVGEPVVVRIMVLSRGQIRIDSLEVPSFPGFSVKEIQKVAHRQEMVENVSYTVLEKRYVITPLEPGAKTIEPAAVVYIVPVRGRQQARTPLDDVFGSFFGQAQFEQKRAVSNPLVFSVDPLPDLQVAIDGVGDFTALQASVDKREAHVNEPVTFKLELVGMGNFDQIPAPRLTLPPFIKAYDSKSSTKEDLSTDYQGGRKRFEYIMQIAQEGDAEIPAQQFTFFDTQTKTVKTLMSPALSVHLTPGAPVQPLRVIPEAIEEAPAEDSHAQKENVQELSSIQEDGPIMRRSHVSGGMINFWVMLFLCIFVPAFIFGRGFVERATQRFLPSFFKNRLYKKRLEALRREFDVLCQKRDAGALYPFFIKTLGGVFQVPLDGVTHEAVHGYLSKERWTEAMIGEFFDFLNACAGYNFIAQASPIGCEFDELLKKGGHWFFLLTSLHSAERYL